jgi:hypothetical protein
VKLSVLHRLGTRKVGQLDSIKPSTLTGRSPTQKSHDVLSRCILAPHKAFVALLILRLGSRYLGSETKIHLQPDQTGFRVPAQNMLEHLHGAWQSFVAFIE